MMTPHLRSLWIHGLGNTCLALGASVAVLLAQNGMPFVVVQVLWFEFNRMKDSEKGFSLGSRILFAL
ncbi:hypothetical protein IQ07DRAFT_589950 [Pyrenochaeta sp. DS3sAY3a]|nr:hypothetical protein IQ07DRAFT_589950 [Pyrenochaeta sp. DS3sAY3a]